MSAIIAIVGGVIAGDIGALGILRALAMWRVRGIAKNKLAIGKALRQRVLATRDNRARKGLTDWLEQNDPDRRTGLNAGL
jgi:hypothetical protein